MSKSIYYNSSNESTSGTYTHWVYLKNVTNMSLRESPSLDLSNITTLKVKIETYSPVSDPYGSKSTKQTYTLYNDNSTELYTVTKTGKEAQGSSSSIRLYGDISRSSSFYVSSSFSPSDSDYPKYTWLNFSDFPRVYKSENGVDFTFYQKNKISYWYYNSIGIAYLYFNEVNIFPHIQIGNTLLENVETLKVESTTDNKSVYYRCNVGNTFSEDIKLGNNTLEGVKQIKVTDEAGTGLEAFGCNKGFNVEINPSKYSGYSHSNDIYLTLKYTDKTTTTKKLVDWGTTIETDVIQVLNDSADAGSYFEFTKPDGTTKVSIYGGGGTPYTLGENLTLTHYYEYVSCIDENTRITMADGTTKAMKDIEIGDEVLSIDWNTMSLIGRKVIYTGKDDEDYDTWTVNVYWKNTFSDGTIIKQAMAHRFYNLEDLSFIYLDEWHIADHTYSLAGNNPTLVSRERVQEHLHYDRITLEESNNFFANGLLTGDRRCPKGYSLTEPLPYGDTQQ